ncbi:MAG: DUF4968 domain-containing protein, partial [Asticcacaulis sp.]
MALVGARQWRTASPFLAASLIALLAGEAQARTLDHFVIDRAGIRLEVSAPRADIIRIRAGRDSLPEDASWAVSQEVRSHRVPLDVTEAAGVAQLRTSELVVKLDEQTLAVTVTDTAGRVVLADAPGQGLSLET